MPDVYSVIVVLLILISSYYWTIHLLVVGAFNLMFRKNLFKNGSKEHSVGFQRRYVIIIPTFGKRRHIIQKLKSLHELQLSCKEFFEKVKNIFIVYSEPDDKVSEELNKYKDSKTVIVYQSKRSGKLHAIKVAVEKLDDVTEDTVCIVTDDDTSLSCNVLKEVANLIEGGAAAVSVYPVYRRRVLDTLYKYKRLIHRLESSLCNPATIGGELLATRCINFVKLREPSLAEDFQLALFLSSNNEEVRVLESPGVSEPYPTGLKSAIMRTRRVILGTLFEYIRYIKHLDIRCKYVASSYLISLMSLSLLPLSILIFLAMWCIHLTVLLIVIVALLSLVNDRAGTLVGIFLGSLISLIQAPYYIFKRHNFDYNQLWKDTTKRF